MTRQNSVISYTYCVKVKHGHEPTTSIKLLGGGSTEASTGMEVVVPLLNRIEDLGYPCTAWSAAEPTEVILSEFDGHK